MKTFVSLLSLVVPLACAAATGAPPTKPKPKTAADVLAASPATDWRPLDPQNTVLMDLPGGQVIIELAPLFAPEHVANIRTLAHSGYWDGLTVLRVQDNFVAQWGDPNGDDAAKAKPLGAAKPHLPAEFWVPMGKVGKASGFTPLPDPDAWAPRNGFMDGMPVSADPKSQQAWLTHCYGMVGAGRSEAKDSSTGAELYAIIGHAPRALDRNITVVGRVIKGIELLASLPRGGANMGFYDKPEQYVGIKQARLLADVPAAEQPALQVLRTSSATWAQLVDLRRNRSGWYVHNPKHVDVCSLSVPTRPVP